LAGRRNVSSEIGMHLLIYRMRPDVGSVVHAHPRQQPDLRLPGWRWTDL
jgi:ribulose-5-phosphate 4-epimerase/fuculose-1-phosphate aldolase